MSRHDSTRWGVWVFVFLATGGVVSATYPGGAAALPRDLWEFTRNARMVEENTEAERRLAVERSALEDRIDRKHQLCGQLARGEAALPEAANAYLEALATDPKVLAAFRESMPGHTDDERAAANLLRDTFVREPMSPGQRYRLLADFHTHYATGYPFDIEESCDGSFRAETLPVAVAR